MKIEKVSIDFNDVVDLLTMEVGGFDYWANIDYNEDGYYFARDIMKQEGVKGMFEDAYCLEEVIAYMIMHPEIPKSTVYAYDFEEDKKYPLSMEMLEKGFLLNAQNRPEDSNLEEGDAETGDCILQYAVFGDIIYG